MRKIEEEGTVKKLLGLLLLGTAMLLSADSEQDGSVDGADSSAAVPEPATIGLMGAGVAAIGFAAWRKNRKK